MKNSIALTVAAIAFLAAASVSGSAMALSARGSIGNGGRMPETMSPGTMPPPSTFGPSAPQSTPSTSYGAQYPAGESSHGGGFQSAEPVTPPPTSAVE